MLTRLILPNLRTRLVAVIFLALLPAFVLLLTIASIERTRAEESAKLETQAMAQLLRSQYEEIISNSHRSLEWLATDPEVIKAEGDGCRERLTSFFRTSGNYLGISVAKPDGTVHCAANGQPITQTLSNAGKVFFEKPKATKQFAVGGVQIGQLSGKPNLTVGYPVLDQNGEVQAVISAGLNVAQLSERLAENSFYQYVALLLIDRNGVVVLRHPDSDTYAGYSVADTDIYRATRADKEGWIETTGIDGVERLFAYSPVGPADDPDLYALASFSLEYVYEGVNRMLRLSLIGLTVIGLAALVSAWLSAEFMIVRRTQQVVNAALRMRGGDFSARVGLSDDTSEMGQLAETFNSMAAALQERDTENARLIAQMQELNAELESRVIKRTEQLQISNVKLLETQADLRRLSEQLMQSIEQERARMSREIHDQLGQLLTAIKMELRTIERLAMRSPEKVEAHLKETYGLLDETIKTVRRIAADLRPGILDDFGLEAAIEWQLQQFRDRTGINVRLDAGIDETLLTKDMSTAAFRILQEALTNIVRHAEATEVDVTVRSEGDLFELLVRDNGKGLHGNPKHKSLGLLGMRERARQLGGSVTVTDGPEGGVVVHVRIPLRTIEVAAAA